MAPPSAPAERPPGPPQKKVVGEPVDHALGRNVVERCINWRKECRALAIRFDKLAVNYLATVKLAILQQYLRNLAPIDSLDRP